MPALPSELDINAAARRLGIANDDGRAHHRDRGRLAETILRAEAEAAHAADHAAEQQTHPTARTLAALHDDLVDEGIPEPARTAILGAAAHTHTARHGITLTDDLEGPTP
ncbi:hypothetical protein [Tomitella fengzijianii]|uniref:Uncharacterized protein n=1 Tax=Tomitella fengzijianii TaxID=2597660 RepID=A0A516X4H8_9ACTN|nr:hypothetical protein [Tomitella fengzijianii]QDQ97982.1 hypothetical protein FO059_12480 [Tomitella fengzijianii]